MDKNKTITITVNDRPKFFKKMLSSLVNNNLHGWHIVVAVEPSKVRDEQLNLVKKFIPQAKVILNDSKLGVRENPFSVLNYVFEKLNSKVNIYLEEDIIISPDVCNLANWYFGVKDKSACLCLCNSEKSGSKQINSNLFSPMSEAMSRSCMFYSYENIRTPSEGLGNDGQHGFSALGIVIKKYQWDSNFKNYWHSDDRGWDWGIHENILNKSKQVLMPYITRSDHIGTHGTHVGSAKSNRKLGFGSLKLNSVIPNNYWVLQAP